MQKAIGLNLRRLRKLRELTQEQLAERAGISRVAYRNIESGKSEPRAQNLYALAQGLQVKTLDLLAEVPQLKSLRFRSRKTMTAQEKAEREQVIVDTANWLLDFNELEELLRCKKTYTFAKSEFKKCEPAEVANEARKRMRIACDECIVSMPDLLESAGVKIRPVSSSLKVFFGLSVGEDDDGPAIAVNVADRIPVERRIFTGAHELAHLLMHPSSFDPTETEEDNEQEHEADRFASYLLMPSDQFDKEWKKNSGLHWVDAVLKTKRRFRVSWMTVAHRLCETKCADRKKIFWQFRTAYAQRYGSKIDSKREPFPCNERWNHPSSVSEEPSRLDKMDFVEDRMERLLRQALEKDLVGVGRAAEMLGLSIGKMRELMAGWELFG